MSAAKPCIVKGFLFIAAIFFCNVSLVHAQNTTPAINPKIMYIHEGKAVSGWGFQLGDPENWSTPVDATRKATSASGKISVEPTDKAGQGDAIKISWSPRKEVKGVIALYGSAIDLSNFKNEGALALDIRLDMKPNKDVTFGMDCGWPCRSEIHLGKTLKDLPKDQWTTVPIPLNCLLKDGFDISKVNGPFVISTDGKLGISIAEVRLLRLPDGEKGCATEAK
ncbi:hypothetical protein GCM10011613_22510 [Cellvibrio zantedeschiae]|uniref:ExoP galactose-binding-like domain-containing protein n=1 Tax=Cellvibrio zantedeschiae TaxID=1237077 RepID=A0ABQ3B6K4_9GAMM|nr:putative glycoside hydrolase [Cellvibrio zantedeschiae]GGY77455.1 hypothetical protein GCM10011613_22510 [Cellvibrio zantedeschiae]